jgi:hypothetical protein
MALGAVEHYRQTSMHCVKSSEPVDPRHLFCQLERDLGERAVVGDTSVGDEHVYPTGVLSELRDCRLDGSLITNIAGQNQVVTRQRLSKLTQWTLAPRNQAKGCSTRSELLAKRFADALGGSGHKYASIRPDLHVPEVK